MRSESKNALSADLSTKGRVVGPCGEKLEPKGSKGFRGFVPAGQTGYEEPRGPNGLLQRFHAPSLWHLPLKLGRFASILSVFTP